MAGFMLNFSPKIRFDISL